MPRALADWLTFIDGLYPRTMELGLERVAQVRDQMGLYPTFPVLMVAGTNGKGSTCAYLTAVLKAAGYRVGTYTSPHLVDYAERVALQGQPVDEARLCRAFAQVEAARQGVGLTPFEYGTLAAVEVFREARVEVAVLEVGLGGRLDAVNLFTPCLTLVTGIALDHQAWLGDTRDAIAQEKAGIFRATVPALCADPDPPASLLALARERGTSLWLWGQDFRGEVHASGCWDLILPGQTWHNLPAPALKGEVQYRNAALALAGLFRVAEPLPVTREAVMAGLVHTSLAGRFQVLGGTPEVVVDVAHNPESAHVLAKLLVQFPTRGKTHIVLGMLRDKDRAGVIEALAPRVDHWYLAALEGERGVRQDELLLPCLAHRTGTVTCFDSPLAAYHAAQQRAQRQDRILVCGSFVTVGQLLLALDHAPATAGFKESNGCPEGHHP